MGTKNPQATKLSGFIQQKEWGHCERLRHMLHKYQAHKNPLNLWALSL